MDGQRSEHVGKLSWRMTALNSCTVTEILRLSSRRKSTADSLIGPSVSTAIGWNEYEAGMSAYLASFLVAAASAADAASAEEAGR